MNYRLLEGVGVATLTPMTEDGAKVNYEAIDTYVDFLVSKGVDGMFVLGTTGEGVSMEITERKKTLERFIAANKGRATIVAHCGAAIYEDIIELVDHAAKAGADAAAIVTPFFFIHKSEELYRFYSELAEKFPNFPLYIYNIPSLTNNWVPNDVIEKLFEKYPNIVGMKDSSGDFVRVLSVMEGTPDSFNMIMGCDSAFCSALLAGAKGCVSGPGAVFPEFFVKVRDFVKEGKTKEAFEAQKSLTKLTMAIGNGANIYLMKKILEWRGVPMGGVRKPLAAMSKEAVAEMKSSIEKVMEEVGVEF